MMGLLVFMVLFSVIEVGRALFEYNKLAEATRLASRVAAVCPVDSVRIDEVAGTIAPGGTVFEVSYLDASGVDWGGIYGNIEFVQVTGVYRHEFLIPVIGPLVGEVLFSPFTTIRPRESLGVVPGEGVFC